MGEPLRMWTKLMELVNLTSTAYLSSSPSFAGQAISRQEYLGIPGFRHRFSDVSFTKRSFTAHPFSSTPRGISSRCKDCNLSRKSETNIMHVQATHYSSKKCDACPITKSSVSETSSHPKRTTRLSARAQPRPRPLQVFRPLQDRPRSNPSFYCAPSAR